MKILFLKAKSKINILKVVKKIKIKNKKFGLVTTVQHLDQLKNIKKILPNSVIAGQVLGCDVSNALKIKKKVDEFLFIGSGEFHPLEIALKTKKKVLIANPYSNSLSYIKKEDVELLKKRRLGAYKKFLISDKIGILVSTKPGQNNLAAALKLKKQLSDEKYSEKKRGKNQLKEEKYEERLKKKSYIFISNEIDITKLEDFSDIQCWVNTACPRIAGKNLINLEDLHNLK